jgi:hypothetical protein
MQVRSSSGHLTALNVTVKTEFKMNIICVGLIILNFLHGG